MKPVVAIDLDGVLASWDSGTHETPGPPIPGAREFVRRLREFAGVVVHTCRCTPRAYPSQDMAALWLTVKSWLDEHDIVVDDIWLWPGKPCADAYIDDRAVPCAPERGGAGEFDDALASARYLCSDGRLHRVFEDEANQAAAEEV